MADGAKLCLTSIGINGEDVDFYDGRRKPEITLQAGAWFVSAGCTLRKLTGKYKIAHVFAPPFFRKDYVLAQCLVTTPIVIEGPNTREEVLAVKEHLTGTGQLDYLIIDGSIDRQFLAMPEVSDSIFFALLSSKRKPQQQKAKKILESMAFPQCSRETTRFINTFRDEKMRSFLFDDVGTIIYRGYASPFADEQLIALVARPHDAPKFLYLNGAMTASLHSQVISCRNLTVILDNFTLYQDYNSAGVPTLCKIELLNRPIIECIFVKEEVDFHYLPLPANVRVHNLFREDFDEIRV